MTGLCQVPSCYMGDFNEIVHVDERQGTDVLPRSAEDFKSWIQDMHLVNLPLIDCKFTWFRGQSCSRIDKALVSLEWLEEFSEIRIRGGPRSLSDHYPVILEVMKQRAGPSAFRSLNSWFTHEGFLRMVKEEWRGLGEIQFTDKLKVLTIPLGKWHKVYFGDMDKKITKFEEEIKKVDDLVSNEMYDGTMEAMRRALVTCCERWIEQEGSVNLEALPTVEKIREAVWDCESSKTRGSDWYNMNFIKRCWGEIGFEFMAAVIGFFQTSRLPADSNITWVALAPKFIGAKEIKDLQPISMVGCVYKVISKVLVKRMRSVMLALVGKTQSAFVKGRKIHDGALIACETVNWIKLRKKEAAIIKLDFQKAYDRVKWSFCGHCIAKDGVDSLLVKYLDIPLGANPRLVKTWKPIIDKVEEKLRDCGFWDGLEWIWNFQWKRELFQWELELLGQLHEALRPVKLEAILPEEITSYSYTKTIWKGLVPSRVELFAWCGVLGYQCLANNGLFQVQ
ncbi:uncharacterized protein LOC130945683 [Arachis stenosperma]|uniref:uncharacterized protein LOC130945683 n=1 Tax=Arachis stenosperma TaxID=217475 RepID=UPI0025AD90AC|nr:uncharacterized protein LOC130945683 [Arachis stenosperma]